MLYNCASSCLTLAALLVVPVFSSMLLIFHAPEGTCQRMGAGVRRGFGRFGLGVCMGPLALGALSPRGAAPNGRPSAIVRVPVFANASDHSHEENCQYVVVIRISVLVVLVAVARRLCLIIVVSGRGGHGDLVPPSSFQSQLICVLPLWWFGDRWRGGLGVEVCWWVVGCVVVVAWWWGSGWFWDGGLVVGGGVVWVVVVWWWVAGCVVVVACWWVAGWCCGGGLVVVRCGG